MNTTNPLRTGPPRPRPTDRALIDLLDEIIGCVTSDDGETPVWCLQEPDGRRPADLTWHGTESQIGIVCDQDLIYRIHEARNALDPVQWWAISSGALLDMLRRVAAGEAPDLVYAEEYANSGHEEVAG